MEGELGGEEGGEPVEGEDGEPVERGAEDGGVFVVEEEGLPDVEAVGEDSEADDRAGVENASGGGCGVAYAPEDEEGDGGSGKGVAEGELPVVLEAGGDAVGDEDDGGREPPVSGDGGVELLEARRALKQGQEAAVH